MKMLEDLAPPQRRAIDLVREVAAEKDCRPFLVGGPVRDILLGRDAFDIDLTLEEGSSTLARALAKRVDGRVRSFPQFLTYKVVTDSLPAIDIATARKERYPRPGALPSVTPGKLKDDLLRRDFSINAIALDLVDGSVHDPTGGQRDLREKVIRVLHDDSFADDPTRVFRAIRLAGRLGYAIEPHTARLLKKAVTGGALTTVSKERQWRELFLAMNEAEAPAILLEMNRLGTLGAIIGKRRRETLAETLGMIQRQVNANAALDRHVLYTSALLGSDASAAQLEGSGFSQKRARNTLQIAKDLPRFEKVLHGTDSDRQRFRIYRSASPEMLSLLAARRPEEEARVARFREYQSFKLSLRGIDLEVPSGPHIAKALERTREAVFNGEIVPEEARAFARRMAIQYLEQT